MNRTQTGLTIALVFFVLFGTFLSPASEFLASPVEPALAAQPFPTVPPQDSDFGVPFVAPPPEEINLEDFILLGDQVYPIGDQFYGEPDIQLAGIQTDIFGNYGVATISGSPDHRLIWINDPDGVRRNLIVHKDDPLYSGENGFLEHYKDYKDDVLKMGAAMGVGLGGAATIVGLGLAGCVPSAGIGCGVALVGGVVSFLGGLFGEVYFGFFEVRPAQDAMDSVFLAIDANRGSQ